MGRTFRLLLTVVVGTGVLSYAVLSAFAGRPLRPSEAWTFAAAVLRATPAHMQGRNPVETLRLGGQAFGSPTEEFVLTVDTQSYTLPLPPHTVRAGSTRQRARFITFATGEELEAYFVSTFRQAGWRSREQLGSARVLERGDHLLSADVKFYRGTRIRELGYSLGDRRARAGLAPPQYPRLTLGSTLRARFAGLPTVGPPRRVHAPSDLLDAAREVVGFLRGEINFDRIRLADTVTLYLSPEGGAFRREVTRRLLRNPSNWKVRSEWGTGFDYPLVPPKSLSVLTTQVGRHSKCGFRSLAPISEELARFPHVGVLLTPVHMESCLQSWNFTLVFDPEAKPPTLIAVVYDQFEW